MDYSKLAFLFPLAVSLLSLYFSVKAWRQANRPIITLRVTSQGKAGNISIPLTLMIENTGNRPAINIRITVDSKVIKKNLLAPKTHVLTQEILRIFSEDTVIPVIGNGKTTSNSFGILSQDENCTWKSHGRFDVSLAYEDIDGRRYYQKHPILISDNDHFADGFWS